MRLAGALTAVLLSVAAGPTDAHNPTPAPYGRSWSVAEVSAGSIYDWDASVPAWLKPYVQDVLQTQWASSATNNSKHIVFRQGAGGSATVYFTNSTGVAACNNLPGWLGCASGAGSTAWKIWLRRSPGQPWCQLNLINGCWDVERIGIHEAGHIGGFLDHMDTSESDTVMTPVPANRPESGWSTHHLQRCDEARMQILYDVASLAGGYADCFDHVPGHGPTGLYSVVSEAAPLTAECYGVGLTLTGRLAVKADSNYGALSGNSLPSRTVFLDRWPKGSTAWTIDYASVATDGGSANNWSRTFSVSGSSGVTTYEFRAHFKGESGLDADYSPVVGLTWSNPC